MKNTKFKKGNPGKPKGAVNKSNKLVKDVVAAVFNDLQEDINAKWNLKVWGKENPKDFYLIAAKLIPVQMQHEGTDGNPIQMIQLPINGRPENNQAPAGVSDEGTE